MPPLPLLIAMMLAFAIGEQVPAAPVPRADLLPRVLEAVGSLLLSTCTAFGVGMGLASTIRRRGGRHALSLRVHSILSAAIGVMNLGVYAWIIFGLGWISVVRGMLGSANLFILDEMLILLPYMLAEIAGWCALYPAARVLSVGTDEFRLWRYVSLRFRLSFGLILPPLVMFAIFGEFVDWFVPVSTSETWWFQLGSVAAVGLLVLTLSPAFVRIALATERLADGPLRRQLERQGQRLGFKTTDILVWKTHGAILNAIVTGLSPYYRYVLLSDGLLETMDSSEVAAIYGHEIGHIRHRHFAFFGFFMLGSSGVLALLFQPLELYLQPALEKVLSGDQSGYVIDFLGLSMLGAYFYFAFGALSRLLERQADVYGCRAVSCGEQVCPPHLDTDVDLDRSAGGVATELCPVGVHTFVDALLRVAAVNGISPERFSWRHGSIGSRVRFLESLIGHPEAEQRFQRDVKRFLIVMVALLCLALLISVWTGSLELATKL